MPRPTIEVADIFRQQGGAYREAHALPLEQLSVMRAIEICRTATLGGHVEQCGHCAHTRHAYNSCRNRHCPKCQGAERLHWLKNRQDEFLPVEYFHVVFTLPEPIAQIAFHNKETVYNILFRTTAETLLTLAADPKHLGAGIGFFAVLHTWGQKMLHHPHLHCVVPGGGLSSDHERWIGCLPGFFLPVKVLARLFRRLFLEALEQAFQQGQLRFFSELAPLSDADAFRAYLDPLRHSEWVVYCKPPFGGPQQVLAYLGRYTHGFRSTGWSLLRKHRVAISNQRLQSLQNNQVTFHWKDYKHKNKQNSKTMEVAAGEFIRRFLLHTLPAGFQRIRHFGFLANCHRQAKLALCRQLLLPPVAELLPPTAQTRPLLDRLTQNQLAPCPHCGLPTMVRVGTLPADRWVPGLPVGIRLPTFAP